jgi:hypothetical protein
MFFQKMATVMSMIEYRVNGVKTREGFTGISTAIIKEKRDYVEKTSRVSRHYSVDKTLAEITGILKIFNLFIVHA